MLENLISKLMQHQNLTAVECETALSEILTDAEPLQVAAFLVLLHGKGETPEELQGLIAGMKSVMLPLHTGDNMLDIVGTGGDGAHTVNISTAASIVAASCGAKIAKHGNRSVSSQCGSADLLAELGIDIHASPEQVSASIAELGIGFCFAPVFHPAMKKIKALRKALGVRTTFNLLGPLLNPAQTAYYLMGVFDPSYLQLFADTLQAMPIKRALVVHGCGLDELSCLGASTVIEVDKKGQRELTIDPKDYGLSYCELSDLQGGGAAMNAKIIQVAFSGEKGPVADTIALNAGAALYVAEKARNIAQGVEMALQSLQQGKAKNLLTRWVNVATRSKFNA